MQHLSIVKPKLGSFKKRDTELMKHGLISKSSEVEYQFTRIVLKQHTDFKVGL